MSQSAKLLIDVFEKLQLVQENHLDLMILVRATCDAIRERFPDVPYEKHVQAVTNSSAIQKMYEQHRIARASIEAAKKQLLEKSDPN